MFWRRKKRIGIFVDGQNIFGWALDHHLHVQYGALLSYFEERGRIAVKVFVTRYEPGNEGQERFLEGLVQSGWEIRKKPLKQRPNGTKRGDMDVSLAVEALRRSTEYDVVVLVSGDGDFEDLVKALRDWRRKEVIVVGPGGGTARELVTSASEFIPAEKVAGFLTEKEASRVI